MIATAQSETIILIALPTMCTFAQSGIVKSRISSEMPTLRQQSSVTGITADEDEIDSAVKMMASLWAVTIIYSLDVSVAQVVHFTFMFAIAAVAAPGVMSGVLMASLGFVESIIGFTPEQISVMMTFYMALDGYGPAANVTGDGAIALIADRFFATRRT